MFSNLVAFLDAATTQEGMLCLLAFGFICAFIGWLLRDGEDYYKRSRKQ